MKCMSLLLVGNIWLYFFEGKVDLSDAKEALIGGPFPQIAVPLLIGILGGVISMVGGWGGGPSE